METKCSGLIGSNIWVPKIGYLDQQMETRECLELTGATDMTSDSSADGYY